MFPVKQLTSLVILISRNRRFYLTKQIITLKKSLNVVSTALTLASKYTGMNKMIKAYQGILPKRI